MMLVLLSATPAAALGSVDIRGGILCSQTAQCASSPVGSPADGRHVCGARGCVCAGNEWSGRGYELAHDTGGMDFMGEGVGDGWCCWRWFEVKPNLFRLDAGLRETSDKLRRAGANGPGPRCANGERLTCMSSRIVSKFVEPSHSLTDHGIFKIYLTKAADTTA